MGLAMARMETTSLPGPVSIPSSPPFPPVAPGGALPSLRSVHGAAVLLLLLGCLTGLAILIRGGDEPPRPQVDARTQELWQRRETLKQRIWELEQRLLDGVPRSIEQNYSDL